MRDLSRDEAKQRVLEATDIVRLIGDHLALKPRGREFVGLCPFHDDHKPSLTVSPAKQFYKCFSCGAGGDVFSFVINYHKMTFPEALRYLADREGIDLPRSRDGAGQSSARQALLQANQTALEFYQRALQDPAQGALAREYLEQRSIDPAMVEAFQVGYAPDAWDALSRFRQERGHDRAAFEAVGLIGARNTGDGDYDRLRHRLIFPILDGLGRPLAFGGRVLPGSHRQEANDAKYLNSPESPLFNKSATLFGLHLAQKPIIDERAAIVVEGYTDVIACHQAGISNTVATLGTALTAEHARLLRRYCDRVILVFDPDEAGQQAAERALGVFFQEPVDIEIAVLPDDLDPADLLGAADGAERFRQMLGQATDAMSFGFERLRQNFAATDTIAGRRRLVEQYLRTLLQLGLEKLDAGRRGLVRARLAELLREDLGRVDEMIRDLAATARRPGAAEASEESTPRSSARHMAERQVIGCLIEQPDLFHQNLSDGRPLHEALVPADIADPQLREVYNHLHKWLEENDELTYATLRDVLPDESQVQLAINARIEVAKLTEERADAVAELLVRCGSAVTQALAEEDYRQQMMEIRDQVDEAGSEDGEASAEEERRRLELAVAHINAHPTAGRIPRTGG